jgi:hypothetical protein
VVLPHHARTQLHFVRTQLAPAADEEEEEEQEQDDDQQPMGEAADPEAHNAALVRALLLDGPLPPLSQSARRGRSGDSSSSSSSWSSSIGAQEEGGARTLSDVENEGGGSLSDGAVHRRRGLKRCVCV